jgi:hypothetical protein
MQRSACSALLRRSVRTSWSGRSQPPRRGASSAKVAHSCAMGHNRPTTRRRHPLSPRPTHTHSLTHSHTHTLSHSHTLSHRPALRARSASLVRSAALAVYRARSMPVDGSKCSLCAAAGDARGGPRRILDGKGPARGEGASPHLGIDELLLRGALEALRPSTFGFAHSPARARCHC